MITKISFLGDISLNDDYVELYKIGVNPFMELEPILAKQDYVMGNLECLAKGSDGENILKKPRLTTTVETLNFLTNIHLDIACLAQNHIYDHLEDGLDKTTNFLNEKNIEYLGAGKSIEEASKEIIIDKNGIKIGILNFVTSDTNPNLPPESKVYLNVFKLEDAQDKIKTLKPLVNHIILQLHWGGRVEGGLYPDFDQPKVARKLIDAGADLIVGHHSHTIQPFEIYNGKYIFYSLGNFCFSDFVFENKKIVMPVRRKISLIVSASFTESSYTVAMYFYKNCLTHFVSHSKYKRKLLFRNQVFKYVLRYYIFWRVYFFNKTFILPAWFFLSRRDINFQTKLSRMYKSLIKRAS